MCVDEFYWQILSVRVEMKPEEAIDCLRERVSVHLGSVDRATTRITTTDQFLISSPQVGREFHVIDRENWSKYLMGTVENWSNEYRVQRKVCILLTRSLIAPPCQKWQI